MINHGIVAPRSQELVDFAFRYAETAHIAQKRKYTGEPYINHSVAVARLVASVTTDVNAICAAFLHDVIEDCGVSRDDLINAGFGSPVADLVCEVSDVSRPEDGNRSTRKAMDRDHYAKASPLGQTIKISDLIDNADSIFEHDPDFARVYAHEMRALLDRLVLGDRSLWDIADAILKERGRF
jgi:(p)ppGpp synthase/HD superfamily hydrolase